MFFENSTDVQTIGNSKPKEHKRGEEDQHWLNFLTNHAQVLAVLHADPKRILREVGAVVGITEQVVLRIVQVLEEGRGIERQRAGRQNRYRITEDEPLRHAIEAHRKIGDRLQLITGE